MVWDRIRSFFKIRMPGWVALLLAIYNVVPDWYGRAAFWLEVVKAMGGKMGLIAEVIASPLFNAGLFLVGILYLLFVGESKSKLRHPVWPFIGWSVVGVVCLVLFAGYVAAPFQQEVADMRKKLDCYVGPPRLISDQIIAITTYLVEHKPHEVTVTWTSFEKRARRYAEDLSEAFRKGDWLVSSDPVQESLPSGITVFYRSNEATQKANQNRRRSAPPNPGEVMKEALRRAELRGSDVPNYSLASDPKLADDEYKVMVTVGLGPYLLGCEETEGN